MTATTIVELHFYLGDIDEGFRWLERACARKEAELLDTQWGWDVDSLRRDPS